MIARVWTGWTETADASAYEEYMHQVALPGYEGVEGNQGVLMLRRDDADSGRTEFTMLSLWTSMESIRAFAGDDPSVAVFYDRDDDYLVEREETARHYVVYGATGLAP
jgi:heme-degrading monooxygenase HmoA